MILWFSIFLKRDSNPHQSHTLTWLCGNACDPAHGADTGLEVQGQTGLDIAMPFQKTNKQTKPPLPPKPMKQKTRIGFPITRQRPRLILDEDLTNHCLPHSQESSRAV